MRQVRSLNSLKTFKKLAGLSNISRKREKKSKKEWEAENGKRSAWANVRSELLLLFALNFAVYNVSR